MFHDLSPDETPQLGFFCEAISGPHAGRYGVYHLDGDPGKIVLRCRDGGEEHLIVDLKDMRPAEAGRR
jgi:hypothetical protein